MEFWVYHLVSSQLELPGTLQKGGVLIRWLKSLSCREPAPPTHPTGKQILAVSGLEVIVET